MTQTNHNRVRVFAAIGAVYAGLAVVLGAMAAHALKKQLAPVDLEIFQTGARYQMYHGLALFAVAWAAGRFGGKAINAAGWLMTVGVVLFSGSIYALTFVKWGWLGPITPIGGVCMITGWTLLAIGVIKGKGV